VQKRYFVGGGPDLEELDLVKQFKSNRKLTDEHSRRIKVLNKFGLTTQSSGSVEFRMHVVKMHELEKVPETSAAAAAAASINADGMSSPANAGSSSKAAELSRNTEAVLKAFQRAKLRSKKVRSLTTTI
jgi:hypothetical protein